MNKTLITGFYFGLAAIALIVVALISIFRPESVATLIQFVGTVMGIASTGAVTFYMLGKQNEKIDVVQKQTNGTLSKLQAQLEAKDRQLVAAVTAHPDAADAARHVALTLLPEPPAAESHH